VFYYLSIGTNVFPQQNAGKIVFELLSNFGRGVMFPFIRTEPVNIESNNLFLNSIFIVETNLEKLELKKTTDAIEIYLGRDKQLKDSSRKDRVADIDILFSTNKLNNIPLTFAPEPYSQAALKCDPNNRIDLRKFGLPSIDRPTAVDLNRRTGQIVIVDNKTDRLENW
jgi:2-amino-4-hydroxy-6-hydroxymethyldihydropteridine diphosphokinase